MCVKKINTTSRKTLYILFIKFNVNVFCSVFWFENSKIFSIGQEGQDGCEF